MKTGHTVESLRAFEADIAAEFNAGKIRAPIHLAGGNEQRLIDIFAHVEPTDWIACTWRSHYHCLLKGVPPERLKADIMAGRSIALCYPEYRIVSSAIVAGALPIALGLAWALKRAGGEEGVWAFLGDMAACTGMMHECTAYAEGHALPINFVFEDNGKSVCSPTAETWGRVVANGQPRGRRISYRYDLPWPHSGAGKRINF